MASRNVTFCALLSLIISSCDFHPKADLVIFNANVYTVNPTEPRAEAIAVVNGKIAYVGNNVNANDWVSDTTKIIDLNGAMLIPGIIEGHGHLMQIGYESGLLDLSNSINYKEIIDSVKVRVEKSKPGQWVLGNGWHQNKWDSYPDTLNAGFPSHDSLSAISTDNPVVLTHASGHALLANLNAMKLAKINKKTQDIEGGVILRDDSGNPIGIFVDNAMKLINDKIPKSNDKEKIEALNSAIEQCLKNGITSFQTAGVGQSTINLFHSFIKNELLKIRLYVMIDGSNESLVQNWFNRGPSIGLADNFLTVRSIKLHADGALGSRSALLLEEYADAPGEVGTRVTELDHMMRITNGAYEKGFQVCTHAIGDRSNREVLDLYEIVLKSDTTKKNPRFRIEHAQHISPEDIPRFGKLGIVPSVQPIHLSSDRPWAIERLGEKRILEGAYAWRKLIDGGATLVNGTDAPIEPINPIANYYAAVTRKTLEGKPDGGFEPDQKLSRKEALQAITINAAYAAFEEDIKGSIELGKLADFTVLSQDILDIPEERILSTEVLYTIVNGTVMYQKYLDDN